LARFIGVAESRQLTARHVLDIVLNHFSPRDVEEALTKLLAQPTWDTRTLYKAILQALRQLEGRLPDRRRTIDMISAKVSDQSGFDNIEGSQIESAIIELANASQGGMTLRDKNVLIHVSYDELERRLGGLTKEPAEPRKLSSFREV